MRPTLADAPLLIVLNAGSGREDALQTRTIIEQLLGEAHRSHRVVVVDDASSLPQIAHDAAAEAHEQGSILVAAGGDGTISTVAHAAIEHGCVLGVLPQGTFNYFSRVHGIPSDTAAATRLLIDGAEPQPVQVGLVNDRLFLVNASLGLYPRLLEDREAYKRRYGRTRLVALWSAFVTLLQAHRPLRLRLESHGHTRDIRTTTVFVGNNALQLQQIGIADAALEQGALVAITLRPVGTLKMLALMLRGALGQLGEAREVFSFPCERLVVRPARLGRREFKVATDGEVIRLRAPLLFRVSPQPLMLLKPRPADGGESP